MNLITHPNSQQTIQARTTSTLPQSNTNMNQTQHQPEVSNNTQLSNRTESTAYHNVTSTCQPNRFPQDRYTNFSQKPSCHNASRLRSALGTRDNYTHQKPERKTDVHLRPEGSLRLYMHVKVGYLPGGHQNFTDDHKFVMDVSGILLHLE